MRRLDSSWSTGSAGGSGIIRFIVVGEGLIDMDGQEYLQRLRKRFSLPIEYETFKM